MMVKRVLLSFMIVFVVSCNSGAKDNESKIDIGQIEDTAINFLMEQQVLEKSLDKKKYYGNLLLIELATDKPIDSEDNGIYRLGVFKSHTKEYLLFKNNREIEIFEVSNLGDCIENLFVFLNRNDVDKNLRTIYIEKVIELYKNNIDRRRLVPKSDNS
ncbi:hypothetical protein [Spongiimicrobium sp. 2-473A-2-J]|uniref:hypothetical protein n=1 Tax=Eudoraea algarum TaxID=3417568 RepID=UPI003D35F6C8